MRDHCLHTPEKGMVAGKDLLVWTPRSCESSLSSITMLVWDADVFPSFMMVKARRSAGKQRVILWFNVSLTSLRPLSKLIVSGWTGMFVVRWVFDGSRTVPNGSSFTDGERKGRIETRGRRLGGVCHDHFQSVLPSLSCPYLY